LPVLKEVLFSPTLCYQRCKKSVQVALPPPYHVVDQWIQKLRFNKTKQQRTDGNLLLQVIKEKH
jgi:hypothetical protein